MTSLTLVRTIAARAATVFDALVSPDGMRGWWGPDGGPVLLAESDRRVGGRFRVRFLMLDGSEHESSGEYLQYDPPHRVAMSWRWTVGGGDGGESRVEISLRAIDAGTELTFTHARLESDESRDSHRDGWAAALAKLAAMFPPPPDAEDNDRESRG